MPLDLIKQKIHEKVDGAPLKAKVKLDLGADGIVFIDATQTPIHISQEDGEADLTLSCSKTTFENILAGTQDPNIAFMMGKLKVKGSMGLAMKLNAILED